MLPLSLRATRFTVRFIGDHCTLWREQSNDGALKLCVRAEGVTPSISDRGKLDMISKWNV